MEGAQVLIFDEDRHIRQVLARLLEISGHQVVAEASIEPEEVREILEQLDLVDADVAVIDPNPHNTEANRINSALVVQMVHQKFGGQVKIFSFGSSEQLEEADAQIQKPGYKFILSSLADLPDERKAI